MDYKLKISTPFNKSEFLIVWKTSQEMIIKNDIFSLETYLLIDTSRNNRSVQRDCSWLLFLRYLIL